MEAVHGKAPSGTEGRPAGWERWLAGGAASCEGHMVRARTLAKGRLGAIERGQVGEQCDSPRLDGV